MHEKSLPPTGARRRMELESQDWARTRLQDRGPLRPHMAGRFNGRSSTTFKFSVVCVCVCVLVCALIRCAGSAMRGKKLACQWAVSLQPEGQVQVHPPGPVCPPRPWVLGAS
jgi:hypothetical protein